MRRVILSLGLAAGLWALVMLGAPGNPQAVLAAASPDPTSPSPAPPAPSPTPPPGTIGLSIAEGPPGTKVTVTGDGYQHGIPAISIYFGDPSKVVGTSPTDQNGHFQTDITVPSVPPQQYNVDTNPPAIQPAVFQVDPVPTPSPSPLPSPSPSPSPSPKPSPSPLVVAPAPSQGGSLVAMLLSFPFVIFPALLLLALLAAAVLWWRTRAIPAPKMVGATVVHRSHAQVGPAGPAGTPPAGEAAIPGTVAPPAPQPQWPGTRAVPPGPEPPAPAGPRAGTSPSSTPPAPPNPVPPGPEPPDPSDVHQPWTPPGEDTPPDLPTPSE